MHLLTLADISEARARPNEIEAYEVETKATGRFDIYIDNIKLDDGRPLHLLVEMKVRATIQQEQCRRYMQYMRAEKEHGTLILPIFVAPTNMLMKETVDLFGDAEWMKVDFQDIYNDVIVPCIDHQAISDFGRITAVGVY